MRIKANDLKYTFKIKSFCDGKPYEESINTYLQRLLEEIEENWRYVGMSEYMDNFQATDYGYKTNYKDDCGGNWEVQFHRHEKRLEWNWCRPL